MKPILAFSLFVCLLGRLSAQQSYTGIVSDNAVNSLIATYNPATIVESKSKLAITLSGNYSNISNFAANNYRVYGSGAKYKETSKPGYKNQFSTFDIINFKYELNHQNALGYSFKTRTFDNLKGIPANWSENAANSYDPTIANVPQDITGFSTSQMIFTEHNFTYARTIFNKQTSLLKAGITLKILNGLNASYFYVNKGSATFLNTSSSNVQSTNLDATFGTAETDNQLFYKNRGIGFDIGAVYEYRPDYEQQYYEMDGAKRNIRYDMNKYKWKVSASITDVGRIRYMNDSNYYNFNNSSLIFDAEKLANVTSIFTLPETNYIKDQMQTPSTKSSDQSKDFTMNLPASFHGAFDMNVYRNFLYVSYNVSVPLVFSKNKPGFNNFFIQTITPRLEKEKFSVMLPLSQMGNGKFYAGLAGRVQLKRFAVFAGSNNVSLFYGKKASFSRNFFAGITYSVWYKVPEDADHDKISDEKDLCPFDPGLAEFQGCPDSDGDGIVDHEDLCIYDKGPRSTNGCPDTDGDGIIDMNDMCPEVKGLGIHYGCPDRDMDGVIDAADRCPDVPGVELNNGCPMEIKGCCQDEDGDGVTNEADKCPQVAGSVYNSGCPIDSANINKINLQNQKEQKDANNTGQQVKENPPIDPRKDLITSQDELAALLADKKVIRNHNVFFDVDEATITDEEQKRLDAYVKSFPKNEKLAIILIGYTDRDGSLDYNLALSKRRAETIQRKLADYYKFDEKQISVYYYGETKSIHKGEYTEEMKAADRKVEIKLIRLPK